MTRHAQWFGLVNQDLVDGNLKLKPQTVIWNSGYLVLTPWYQDVWSDRDTIFPHILIWWVQDSVIDAIAEHTYWRDWAQRQARIEQAISRMRNVAVNERMLQLPPEIARIFSNPDFRGRLLTPSHELAKVIITTRGWVGKPFVWTAWGELGNTIKR